MTPRYKTTQLTPADLEAGFSSGVHALDDYFRRHALPNQTQGISLTFVLRRDPASTATPEIVGFYTLSMTSIASASIAPLLASKPPRYDMPAALLGRLAVHKNAQRKGFGEQLLADAVARVLEVAQDIGCVGLVVDAKDAAAVAFYKKYSFTIVGEGQPSRMFVPVTTLRAAAQPVTG